jgi:hypothetical protein
MSRPEILFDPDLMESAVKFRMERARADGRPEFEREYRERADRAYEDPPGPARFEAFAALHKDLFREWGLDALFSDSLSRCRGLAGRMKEILIGLSSAGLDEGADLGGSDHDRLGILVDPRRLLDPLALGAFLERELEIAGDLLDPDFGYDAAAELPVRHPTERFLVRERLRLLWAVRVEKRLETAGRSSPEARADLLRRFAQLWSELGEGAAEAFEALWRNAPADFASLLRLVADPAALAAHCGVAFGASRGRGLACPLCGFPTHDWGPLDREVVPLVRADFPEWRPELGLCARCFEGYMALREVRP